MKDHDPFHDFSYGSSSLVDFDVHESKPFVENAHVMDNFQCGGYNMNPLNRNYPVDMMAAANQSCLGFNSQEIVKPVNFVVPDEVSSISPGNHYKRVQCIENNRISSITRRTCKVRKNSNIVKGQWTVEEDRLLIQLVEQHGVRKWSHFAQMLSGRRGKQCRERWQNHLSPDIKKDSWTDEADKILIQSHAEMGNKWAEIAKRLPGRTENSIKNHWNATQRRQYSKRKRSSKYPRGSLLQEYIKSLDLDQNPPIDYRKISSAKPHKAMTDSPSTSKAATQDRFCPNDRLVPSFDFNDAPDFCLNENLFPEGCNIDSLLDDMPSASAVDGKDFQRKMPSAPNMVEKYSQGKISSITNVDEHQLETEIPQQMAEIAGNDVKQEMDLEEMMSQMNEVIDIKCMFGGVSTYDSATNLFAYGSIFGPNLEG